MGDRKPILRIRGQQQQQQQQQPQPQPQPQQKQNDEAKAILCSGCGAAPRSWVEEPLRERGASWPEEPRRSVFAAPSFVARGPCWEAGYASCGQPGQEL
eukprot:6823163-Pyramimonas_sp.AAC.1